MQISKPQQDETIQTTVMCKMAKTKKFMRRISR